MKVKKYGKNKIAFKKLIKDSSTKITYKGNEAKKLFESLIGYDYSCYIEKNILKVVDMLGDTFIIETNLELELV